MDTNPITRAVAAAGGEQAFLERAGISRRTLYYWRSTGIPLCRVARVAQITGLPAHELRPDLIAPAAAPEAA